MNNKKNKTMWGISLFIIVIATAVNAFSSFLGIELPDMFVRVLGVITLVTLPVLVYSSTKILKGSKS